MSEILQKTIDTYVAAHPRGFRDEGWGNAVYYGYETLESACETYPGLADAVRAIWPQHCEETYRIARGWAKCGAKIDGGDTADLNALSAKQLAEFDRSYTPADFDRPCPV